MTGGNDRDVGQAAVTIMSWLLDRLHWLAGLLATANAQRLIADDLMQLVGSYLPSCM